ncbi:MAG: hypothetical protein CBB97_22585 [Candidatus Endolissoclinum sp. TMED37]|nr:MAG: hypothetical protein CBB97_22585 [Candidatus Endolissoclinum sp. TMED37]
MESSRTRILVLFDVDGTLTPSRKSITPEMLSFLKDLRRKVTIGIVGGSDLNKQKEQLGNDVTNLFDYTFAENGLTAYKGKYLINRMSLVRHLGEDTLKRIINWVLMYLGTHAADIPLKRGTFIEYRSGMLNISPIGRQCSVAERDAFELYDKEHCIRAKMIEAMRKELADIDLQYSIGGQISFDVFPKGWDKTFCLRYVESQRFDTIHFFGDKTMQGGNDYEIYEDERTIGHSVTSPEDTIDQCNKLFFY